MVTLLVVSLSAIERVPGPEIDSALTPNWQLLRFCGGRRAGLRLVPLAYLDGAMGPGLNQTRCDMMLIG